MQTPEQIASEMHPGRLAAIAAVRRELAEMDAADEAATVALQGRAARARGISMVYSIRLDRAEVETLERRAAAHGLKPTVLARNLIRVGLAPRGAADMAIAVDRVAAALAELRALLGSTAMQAGSD